MSDLQISSLEKLHNEHEQNSDCNGAPNLNFGLNNKDVFIIRVYIINLKENRYLNTLYVVDHVAMNHSKIRPSCINILLINQLVSPKRYDYTSLLH